MLVDVHGRLFDLEDAWGQHLDLDFPISVFNTNFRLYVNLKYIMSGGYPGQPSRQQPTHLLTTEHGVANITQMGQTLKEVNSLIIYLPLIAVALVQVEKFKQYSKLYHLS